MGKKRRPGSKASSCKPNQTGLNESRGLGFHTIHMIEFSFSAFKKDVNVIF